MQARIRAVCAGDVSIRVNRPVHPVLGDAAQDAAADWQFNPGRTHDGEPVAGLVTMPVDFFLG